MKFPKRKKEIKQLKKNLAITSKTIKMRSNATKSFDDNIKFYEKMAKKSKVPSFKKSMNELVGDIKRIKNQYQRRSVERDSQFDTPSVHKKDQKRLRTLLRR
jgi:rubrerythrin